MRINADLIARHNQDSLQQGYQIEDKFASPGNSPERLEDLLWQDFAYLVKGAPVLRTLADRLVLAELAGPVPNAFSAPITDSYPFVHLLGFRSPLLYLVNSVFSKMFVLMHDNRFADCLPEDAHHFEGDSYSDTTLLAKVFNDVEVLYERRRLFVPFDPPHMAVPYDYCEQAEGARRFVLAHELGHALCREPNRPAHIQDRVPSHVFGSQLSEAWAEECWCDAFAISTILDIYAGQPLEGAPLYELENTLIGALLLFVVFDIADASVGRGPGGGVYHPTNRIRREVVRRVIKRHEIYQRSLQLQKVLQAKWRRLNATREFAGGANAPVAFQLNSLWSYPEFLTRLTDYGARAYRALFDVSVAEFSSIYGDDASAQRQDDGYF